MAARSFRSTWFVLSVILLVDCGGSRGDKQDAALPVADGTEGVALLSDSEPPISNDGPASISDAAESPIDLDAMSLDAALSVDEGPSRNSCSTEQRYPASPCPGAGWFLFTDTRCYLCGPSDPKCSSVGHYCESWGDNRCYRQCKTNADCTDPCTPLCRELTLFSGGDHCGLSQMVCVHKDQNYCGDIPSDQHH